jgi:hypothetical protein
MSALVDQGDLPVEPDLTPVAFGDMSGAVTEVTHQSANRMDPYWHDLSSGRLTVSWESRATIEMAARDGLRPVAVRDLRNDPEVSARMIRNGAPDAIATLGAVAMWRTATTDQLSAFAGWVDPARQAGGPAPGWAQNPSACRRLFSAGLVERGRFGGHQRGRPVVWRPINDRAAARFLTELAYADWVATTACQPWSVGPPGDRHNLLGTELGLRIAEFCDVATVLGESCSTHELVVGSAASTPNPASGDLTVVREDGLRIAFELTALQNPKSIRRKVDRWLDTLLSTSFATSGAVVCFVDATDPAERSGYSFSPLRRAIADAIATRPGAAHGRLAERVALARWRWWFPDLGAAAPGFATLLAYRPTGPAGARWEPAHLLDVTDVVFDPSDAAEVTAVIGNSRLLAGTPYWVRDRLNERLGVFDMDGFVARRAGATSIINAMRSRKGPPTATGGPARS